MQQLQEHKNLDVVAGEGIKESHLFAVDTEEDLETDLTKTKKEEEAKNQHKSIGVGRGKGGYSEKKFTKKKKWHTKKIRANLMDGITKPSIRRLARRAGIKRISSAAHDTVRVSIDSYVTELVNNAITYMEHAKRKTVTVGDVVASLKRSGRILYGFE